MSTDFRPLTPIRMAELFDGRLERVGVWEHHPKWELAPNQKILTDGSNYLHVYSKEKGLVSSFSRYMPNGNPGQILTAISDEFDVDIVSEYEPQFWGFDTQEEWDAYMEEMSRKHEEEYYIELVKYLRGEPNDIRQGTIGMIEAEIAKTLVEKDPSLLLPINKDKLRNDVRSIYDREHAVKVALGPKDLALVRMLSTDEDDLPSA
jgi:hypothetical protein